MFENDEISCPNHKLLVKGGAQPTALGHVYTVAHGNSAFVLLGNTQQPGNVEIQPESDKGPTIPPACGVSLEVEVLTIFWGS